MPFIGISPHRYRDIFQKTIKRKRDDGSAKRWLMEIERPIIDNPSTAYVEREPEEYLRLLGKFEPRNHVP
jgi:cytidine deaminase